jgi:hypothetical protein
MLVHAGHGRETMAVNGREQGEATCTTFAEFDQIRAHEPQRPGQGAGRKRPDARSSAAWVPVPCPAWSMMQLTFRRGPVVEAMRRFSFG